METKTSIQTFNVAPSRLDDEAEVACPFYKGDERAFSTIYARQHAQVTTYLAAVLQERFQNLVVEGEAPLASEVKGYLDLKFVLRNSQIIVENGGGALCALEVKTGAVKICQPACYAATEGIPVLLAEAKTGDVFIVTPEAGQEYLGLVGDLFQAKAVLERRGVYSTGRYCGYCVKEGCLHHREGYIPKTEPSLLLDENMRAFSRNLPIIVEKISRFIEDLLHEKNEGPRPIASLAQIVGVSGG